MALTASAVLEEACIYPEGYWVRQVSKKMLGRGRSNTRDGEAACGEASQVF